MVDASKQWFGTKEAFPRTKDNLIMLDLKSLDTTAACDKPAEIELKHPVTREGLGQFISVVGKDSTIFRNEIRKRVNADERKADMARRLGQEPETRTIESKEAESIDLLVICTVGFRDVNYGGAFEYSPDNARKLYTEQVWIRQQVDAAIGNLANFMKG